MLEAPAPETVVRAARHLGGDARLRVAAAGTCLEAGEIAQAQSLLEGLGDAPGRRARARAALQRTRPG